MRSRSRITVMRSTTFSTTRSARAPAPLPHPPPGQRARARRRRLIDERLDRLVLLVLVGDELRVERLRELRAVAVERIGLEPQLPREQIGGLAILDPRLVG